MNRILIVDDEHHIVNWLFDLISSQENLSVEVMKAYSGYEAIEVLKKYKIYLLLLDINMPGMTGLEMAEMTLAEWPETRIIFLTAHDNFEYIYKVNHLKNTTYLLKTEDDSVILDAVYQALDALRKEDEVADIIELADARELAIKNLTKQKTLCLLLQGTHTLNRDELHQFKQSGVGITFEQDTYLLYTAMSGGLSSKSTSRTSEKLRASLLSFTNQYVKDKFRFEMLEQNPNNYLWIFEDNRTIENPLGISSLSILENLSEDMISITEQITSRSLINVLYTLPVDSENIRFIAGKLIEYGQDSIRKQINDISYCTLMGENDMKRIISKEADEEKTEITIVHPEELSASLTRKDKKAYMQSLYKLKEKYQRRPSMHDLEVIQIYNSIALSLMRYVTQHSLEEKIAIKIALYPLYYLQDFRSWKEAFNYLLQFSGHLFDLLPDTEDDRNERLLTKIEKYILSNLSHSLTLSEIASIVNYNAKYVSRLYQNVRGFPLPKFILQRRIELAEKLLSQTNESIQKIAKQTGFDTSQYFSIVFKKETGMTPREYRNTMNKAE